MFQDVVNPISDTISWPWPQLILTKRYVLLATGTAVYSLDGSWSRTKVFDCAAGGDQWEVMDFGTYLLMCNGQQIFERDPDTGTFSESAYTSVPKATSVCNFNGQIFATGILSSWYDCNERYAAWSRIDTIEFTPDEKNISGYRDMQIGTTYKCCALRKNIIVFGDEGIATLSPLERIGAHAYRMLTANGISGRNLAAGNSDECIAITDEYKLWQITDEGIQELGFEHHLQALTLTDVVITQDENKKEFYISDSSKCFVYARGELYERGITPTSLINVSETLYGVYETISTDIHVGTDELDFNLVGKKNYEFIELGLATDGTTFVRAKLYYDNGNTIVHSPWNRVNPDGFGYIGVAGNKANIELKIENASTAELRFMTVGYKATDNRIQNQKQTTMDGTWNGR